MFQLNPQFVSYLSLASDAEIIAIGVGGILIAFGFVLVILFIVDMIMSLFKPNSSNAEHNDCTWL